MHACICAYFAISFYYSNIDIFCNLLFVMFILHFVVRKILQLNI